MKRLTIFVLVLLLAIAAAACGTDYSFSYGDTELLYHSECGTFIELDGGELSLNNQEMRSVNGIIGKLE